MYNVQQMQSTENTVCLSFSEFVNRTSLKPINCNYIEWWNSEWGRGGNIPSMPLSSEEIKVVIELPVKCDSTQQ